MVNPTITVRLGEEELRRLDELAQRMGVTRSDVIRSLVNNFDEALKQEVDRERKRWMAIGFVGALESAILDPEVIVRFVRRNVDVLGYPDFLIGMVRIRNRVVVLSHHDKVGNQLLQLVRAKVENEVRREEAEIEREEDEGEDVSVGGAIPAHVHVRTGVHPRTPHAIPETAKYRIMISNRSGAHIPRPTAVATAGRSGSSGGSGGAKATVVVTVPENQKLAGAGLPTANKPTGLQPGDSNSHVTTNGGGPSPAETVTQVSTGKPGGDFVFALVANLYHKHRDGLLKLIEGVAGD